ncbi:unnamed protein product [Soboliphyme baturini]|uniref:CUB_2 domain-containing protein n=1 Tax=Soboliphyme baturini TaxID=241478 RepID=A0A183IHN7_9BILA|nr:unnamed protein product [Soboliphyme baturini]
MLFTVKVGICELIVCISLCVKAVSADRTAVRHADLIDGKPVSHVLCVSIPENKHNYLLSVKFNPGCPANYNCSKSTCSPGLSSVIYFEAVGPSDTLHYIFSDNNGPSLLVLVSPKETSIHFDWNLVSQVNDGGNSTSAVPKVIVDGPLTYEIGIVFNRVYRLSDAKDYSNVLDPSPSNCVEDIPMKDLRWKNVTFSTDLTRATVTCTGPLLGDGGSISITINPFTASGVTMAPGIAHTDSAAIMDIQFVSLVSFNHSHIRYALQLSAVSTEHYFAHVAIDTRVYFDDQNSPGIFYTDYLESASDGSGYFAWKPASYLSPNRNPLSLSQVSYGPPVLAKLIVQNCSNVVENYFGTVHQLPSLSYTFNITFGAHKDAFYKDYLVW